MSIFCKLYLDYSFLGSGLQQIVVSEMFVLLMPPCAVKSSMCTALLEESPHKVVNNKNSIQIYVFSSSGYFFFQDMLSLGARTLQIGGYDLGPKSLKIRKF